MSEAGRAGRRGTDRRRPKSSGERYLVKSVYNDLTNVAVWLEFYQTLTDDVIALGSARCALLLGEDSTVRRAVEANCDEEVKFDE